MRQFALLREAIVEFRHSQFVKHGIVVLASDPSIRFPLFRSDQVICATGEVARGKEWWCVDQPEGPDVEVLNSECTRFQTSTGDLLLLEPAKPQNAALRSLARFRPAPAPEGRGYRKSS